MKKSVWMMVSFLFSFSVLAAPGPDFERYDCVAWDGEIRIEAVKETCQDERYQTWNPNGCYQIKVFEQGTLLYQKEFLRDFTHRETQQGFYSLYDYDEDTWIQNGMIIRLEPDTDKSNQYRLDKRGNSRTQMEILSRGQCRLY